MEPTVQQCFERDGRTREMISTAAKVSLPCLRRAIRTNTWPKKWAQRCRLRTLWGLPEIGSVLPVAETAAAGAGEGHTAQPSEGSAA